MSDAPVQFVDINSIHTAEAITGEGQPVLLLHGWGVHIGLVWPLGEQLARAGYRAYMLDLPGHGQTDDPPEAWSVHEYVDFVLAYLDYHKLDKVCLFGHSFGGRLSLVLGAEHSERILKIALSNSAGIRAKPSFMSGLRQKTYKTFRDSLAKSGAPGLSEALRNWYTEKYGSTDYKNASGVMRETFVKVVNEDLSPYAARVKPSTLLFWGDKDEDTPLWQGRKLEELIPDAGLVLHEGAGHYAYLERLADTVRVMDYFFRQGNKT